MKNIKKLVLVGGGTGGHAVPVLEIYKSLKKSQPTLDIKIIGSGNFIERDIFKGNRDYKIIPSGKMHRVITWRNIREFLNLIRGIFSSFFFLLSYKPDLVFSKGGYVSLPIIFWAKLFRIPYFIHESDIEMGVSNQYAVSDAKKVFVGFPLSFYENKNESFIHAGQIIRDNIELTSGYDFGFKQNKPVVLITGGSQGSRIVNKTTLQILKKLTENFNVIHQSGRLDFLEVKKEADLLDDSIKSSYFLTEFLNLNGETDLMLSAIKEASIIVTRAGATTVAEVIAMQKPMILIPYKHAAGDHQSKNAQLLEESKAAIVLGDDQLNSEVLLEKILYLSHNKDKALNMVKNAKGHFPQNGLKIVTEAILKELE